MIKHSDITVIIPVHEWNENVEKLFGEAVKSVPKDIQIIVSTTSKIAKEGWTNKYKIVKHDKSTSFQSLVNAGVNEVKTEWFSILEFDDEYSPIWFDNFIKYQEYNQQYNIFLPLNDLYNVEGGKDEFVGNGNEAVWAASFSDEIGVIDERSLDDYFDFYLTGGIFRKSTWDEIGGLKESIKLTFWYEFMLRASHKGEKIYVVPKVGYAHILGRDGSLMVQYRSEMDTNESDFWYKIAKKESYHKEDRNRVYNPTATQEEETED